MAEEGLLGRWATVPTISDGALRPPGEIAAAIIAAMEAG
jgi:dTMP kinase